MPSKFVGGVEYTKVEEVKGPLLVIQGVTRAAFDELVEIETATGERRLGKVLEVGGGRAVVQVFEGTSGLSVVGTRARFLGRTMETPVSSELLGRVFDGLGRPLDGLPDPVGEDLRDVNGSPLNPERRDYPTDFIQTGVSVMDGMLTLVRGQKLPIFSGAGMPHNMLAAQVARQATVLGRAEEFAVVFAAIGVQHGEASFFKRTLEESGAIRRSALFLNLADDPAIERVITPRVALTAAEYFAFDLGMHVLVILSDITNYAESLREVSAAREEVPGRKGYPGYLYSVDGSRRVVLRDSAGSIKIISLTDFFRTDEGQVEHDGPVERKAVGRWETLCTTPEGRSQFCPVQHVVRHPYNGRLIRILTQLGETIVTPNHSVFTIKDGLLSTVKAGDLQVGDLLAHVAKLPEHNGPSPLLQIPSIKRRFRRKVPLTPEMARLIGYYVSEGHSSRWYDPNWSRWRYQVCLTNNSPEIIGDMASCYEATFGRFPPTIHICDKRSGTLRVAAQRKYVYDFLTCALGCGHRSFEKRVPSAVLSASRTIKEAFFGAYYGGDGGAQSHHYKIKQYSMVTISPGLRDDPIFLCRDLYPDRTPSLTPTGTGGKGHLIYLSTYVRRQSASLNDVISVEVKEVKEVDPTESWVYDLSVEGADNFVDACGLVLLHNTDLASNYERAGRIKGRKGSITQMPILSMPSDDITHPIPDLTGYITEGQIVLSRELFRKGVYPPVGVLMCLSRLMKDGVGEGKTRSDHMEVSNQLYDAYARAQELRALAEIIGKAGLTGVDLKYLEYGDLFERRFLRQGYDEDRSIDQTLGLAWEVLSKLPEGELTKIRESHVKKYYGQHEEGKGA